MAQARRGRPRKAGARNAKGRLILLPDRGNMRVQARSAAFACFHGGHAEQQVADQVGRAWAAGLLDGTGCDAVMLRDIGRRYAGLYWHQFAALAPTTGQWERRDRSAPAEAAWDDRAGDYFKRLDALAESAGHAATAAMHSLCVDGWWFPDTNAPWVDRLINSAIRDAGGNALGKSAEATDRARMRLAMEALTAMVAGRRR